jgi:hypothetical protein
MIGEDYIVDRGSTLEPIISSTISSMTGFRLSFCGADLFLISLYRSRSPQQAGF